MKWLFSVCACACFMLVLVVNAEAQTVTPTVRLVGDGIGRKGVTIYRYVGDNPTDKCVTNDTGSCTIAVTKNALATFVVQKGEFIETRLTVKVRGPEDKIDLYLIFNKE